MYLKTLLCVSLVYNVQILQSKRGGEASEQPDEQSKCLPNETRSICNHYIQNRHNPDGEVATIHTVLLGSTNATVCLVSVEDEVASYLWLARKKWMIVFSRKIGEKTRPKNPLPKLSSATPLPHFLVLIVLIHWSHTLHKVGFLLFPSFG